MYDIIIIGGNLSGVIAAINAVKKGVKVALIERHKKPFSPAHCGEAISSVTANFLKIDKRKCPKNEIREIKINISSSKEYTINLSKNKIFVIDRNYLENDLLNEAEEKNVKLYLGRRMLKFNPPNEIIMDNNKKIDGKIIIDARGISCTMGRQIGINTKLKPEEIGVCIQSRIQSKYNPNNMYMWWGEPYAPLGYAWLFPINKELSNIGIGIIGGQQLDITSLLKEYINLMIKRKYKTIHTFRACEPMVKPLDNIVINNVMFVGDSARLADPSSGAGIHNAIFSGSLAGLTAASYINGEIRSLNIYQELMKNKMNRIRKTYKNKCKLTSSRKYDKAFNRLFSTINILNKIIPNFYQRQITKMLEKDIKKIELLNKTLS
ncbi:MAG: NAD(P)/FAD-dependent oxidoreductase [Candidatus Thermoplasmatota archaeon]